MPPTTQTHHLFNMTLYRDCLEIMDSWHDSDSSQDILFFTQRSKKISMRPPVKIAAGESRFLRNKKYYPDNLFGLFYLKKRRPSYFENKCKQ
jgi:hypothetical protein